MAERGRLKCLINPSCRKGLQSLKRFFGERFRPLEFGTFVIRSAEADRDEGIAF